MFFDYLQEKDGVTGIETGDGFLCYKIFGKQFYISDFYLKKEKKNNPSAVKKIFQEVKKICDENECTTIGCHIDFHNLKFNEVLLSRLKFGFKVSEIKETKLGLLMPVEGVEKWVQR